MKIIKELNVNKNDSEKLLDEGIWLTGNNKGIKISEIEDVEYLQKILYTLQNREKKAIEYYRNNLNTLNSLYCHVFTRCKELDANLKLDFVPLEKHLGFEELKDSHKYFLDLLNQTKKE